MLNNMLIRKKILIGTVMLIFILIGLMYCSLSGAYAYRHLTLMVEQLATELHTTSDLRVELDKLLRLSDKGSYFINDVTPVHRSDFRNQLHEVDIRLEDYERQLASYDEFDHFLADRESELSCVQAVRMNLEDLKKLCQPGNTNYNRATSDLVKSDIQLIVDQVQQLPTFVLDRMRHFRGEVRSRYRALIIVTSITSLIAITIVVAAFCFFRISVVGPFKTLIAGSRKIAKGDFTYRVQVESKDELAELADALNNMTDRFVEVEENLNEKVKQRTQEVVRSEQLASVGFLAAGVAHEINNPLASIAWSAEALESRLHEILNPAHVGAVATISNASEFSDQEIEILRKYLSRIQDEAFRCKGITEKLLDFSRIGESQRKQMTDISESVRDVVELVQHLGQYRNKRISLCCENGITGYVSPTEFKQVTLNLLTNALDASDDGDTVKVELGAENGHFRLSVKDTGCGMTEETKQHLFEPFFTRRRDGRGTGLGMSISYRIVQDHGGTLVPFSAGPGQGATMTLSIPMHPDDNQSNGSLKAA